MTKEACFNSKLRNKTFCQ